MTSLLMLALGCALHRHHGDSEGADDTVDTEVVDSEDSDSDDTDTEPVDTGPFDEDGDGFSRSADCDDTNPSAYPGAPVDCHGGIDHDCDGAVDTRCTEEVADWVWTGEPGTHSDGYGGAVWLSDLNGDSRADILISAGGWGYYVVYGDAPPSPTFAAASDAKIASSFPDQYFFGITAAGDLTGDGIPDVVVYNSGQTRDRYTGLPADSSQPEIDIYSPVNWYHGIELHETDASVRIVFPTNELLPFVVDPGDLDGDGRMDSAAQLRTFDGVVFFLAANETAWMDGTSSYSSAIVDGSGEVGWKNPLGGADFDGDGRDDQLVACTRNYPAPESVCLFDAATLSGASQVDMADRDIEWSDGPVAVATGDSTHWVGDIDGDGLPDAVFGIPYESHSGTDTHDGTVAFMLSSAFSGASTQSFVDLPTQVISEMGNYDLEGYHSAGGADWNLDGHDEVFLSGSHTADGAVGGRVCQFDGATLASGGVYDDSAATWCVSGATGLGWGIASGKDVDGDGRPDLVAVAPDYDDLTSGGFAYLFEGW